MEERVPVVLATQVKIGRETRQVIDKIKRTKIPLELSADVRSILAKPRVLPLTTEWHNMRGKLLTASAMAACLGENVYCDSEALFKRKTNQCEAFQGNTATRWGQTYELEASQVYSVLTGMTLINEPIGLIIHPYEKDGQKRYAATPDFITTNGIVVEIKCPYSRRIRHEMPRHYVAQLQMQLEVTGAVVGHFVQYKPPGMNTDGVFDLIVVPRDPSWWVNSLPIFDDFWDRVVDWYQSSNRELGHRKITKDYSIDQQKAYDHVLKTKRDVYNFIQN